MRKILFAGLRAALGIGLLVYLVDSGTIEGRALTGLFPAWRLSLAAVALVVADLALMAWRLRVLFRPQRLLLSRGDALRLTFVGSFFSNFLPGRAGGDLAKIFYASKENAGRRPEIIAILLLDRAIGLFSLLLLPLLMLPFFPGLMRFDAIRIAIAIMSLLAVGMIVALLCGLFAPAFLARWGAGARRIPGKELFGRLLKTVSSYREHSWTLGAALLLSLGANLILVGTLLIGVVVVDPAGLDARLLVLAPIGQVVNSLPLTPGGLGVGESAFQALFGLVGVTSGASALICWRIWNFIASLAGLIFYLRGFRARIPMQPREPARIPARPGEADKKGNSWLNLEGGYR